MKPLNNLITLLSFLILNVSCSSDDFNGVFDGDYVIKTQKNVNFIQENEIKEITGNLRIDGNDLVNPDLFFDFTPLSSLTKIGGSLNYDSEGGVSSLDGLDNLTYVGEGISIESYTIENLDALSNVTGNLTFIILRHMDYLTNLNGLSGIESTSRLTIDNLKSLQSLDGLEGLEGLEGLMNMSEGRISITDNEILTDISQLEQVAFENLESVNLHGNPNLQKIDFMLAISAVSHNISINNTALTNLDALANLNSVGHDISIRLNSLIQDLSSLSNLEYVGGSLFVYENSNLINLCGIQNLVNNGEIVEQYYVEDNAYNPTQQDIIDGNCSL